MLVCFAIFKTKLKRIVSLKLRKILKIRPLHLYMSLLLCYNFIYGVIESQSLCLSKLINSDVQFTSRLHYNQFRVSLVMVTVRLPSDVSSSVARGGGGGGGGGGLYPSHWPVNQNAE